jgi:hypothetical protein
MEIYSKIFQKHRYTSKEDQNTRSNDVNSLIALKKSHQFLLQLIEQLEDNFKILKIDNEYILRNHILKIKSSLIKNEFIIESYFEVLNNIFDIQLAYLFPKKYFQNEQNYSQLQYENKLFDSVYYDDIVMTFSYNFSRITSYYFERIFYKCFQEY